MAIAWRDGFDAALAAARSTGRSVFLYWGARWCPPCNRIKADVFARDDFAERLAGLVPVWIDGDAPAAQALAERLKLRSYPTLVLYTPAGAEITRLPCELDGEAFVTALDAALDAPSSASSALNAALEGRPLGPDSWNLLAHYSWDTDDGAILHGRDLHNVLASLAAACPVPAAAARFRLLALGLRPDPSFAPWLLALCNDAALSRACMDLFLNNGNLVRQSGHADVAAALARTAQPWAEDMGLSSSDRLMAVRLRLRMARLGAPLSGMPEAVQSAVRDALAAATDPHERHTLVNTAYSALNDAGLHGDAEALLRAELPASHAPYYFMLSLASAARRRGDIAGMLDWYEQAWRTSTGPATRLQWGTTYLTALLDTAEPVSTLVPDPKVDTDSAVAARIEAASAGMLDDVTATPDAFSQRNGAQLAKLAARLASVDAPGERTAALLALLRR